MVETTAMAFLIGYAALGVGALLWNWFLRWL